MIRKFLLNAVNSWVMSSAGAIAGLPMIWSGLKGVMDEDPATGFVFKTFITGLGILFAGLMGRDHTKAIVPKK